MDSYLACQRPQMAPTIKYVEPTNDKLAKSCGRQDLQFLTTTLEPNLGVNLACQKASMAPTMKDDVDDERVNNTSEDATRTQLPSIDCGHVLTDVGDYSPLWTDHAPTTERLLTMNNRLQGGYNSRST